MIGNTSQDTSVPRPLAIPCPNPALSLAVQRLLRGIDLEQKSRDAIEKMQFNMEVNGRISHIKAMVDGNQVLDGVKPKTFEQAARIAVQRLQELKK